MYAIFQKFVKGERMITDKKNEQTETKFNKFLDLFHVKVFIVIFIIAVIIVFCALAAGALLLKRGAVSFNAPVQPDSFVFPMSFIIFILAAVSAAAAALILKRPYEKADRLKRAAEAASESKSSFLAMISHEIRTPMNSIVGFSELAIECESALRTKEYLNKILANADWLLNITNDMLDISRVESGRLKIDNIPFDMHEVLSSCRTLILPKASEKGLALFFYVEPSLGKRPLGDPVRLRQVLVNLLSNAVKFTNTGMVKLNAVLKDMNENTFTMYFEVKDSGIGMTEEQIKNLFDLYEGAETGVYSGMSRKFHRAGLGLSIAKNLIELMGGRLYVESNPGIGSKFYFDLVFDSVSQTDEELFDKKLVFNELETPYFRGEILLCEDNLMNQQVICQHLSRVGIDTVLADNGKIGYEMVKSRNDSGEKQFDLILMDIHMPVMDGLEASMKIMELNTGVPIVALTANVMYNDREIYKKNGMHDCVGKPFTSQELWRCLMKYFIPVSLDSASGAAGLPAEMTEQKSAIEADMEFQKRLQDLFVEENKNIFNEIVTAMESGDIDIACRLTYTLKCNAGQIGKVILQKVAADIENKLKYRKAIVTGEQLKILKTELDLVLSEFSLK